MARNKLDKGVTLVAANTQIIGDVKFQAQLYVNGKVSGNVLATEPGATVIVSEEGSVEGEIRVPNIVINGTVIGDVHAGERVELAPKAKIRGNVYYQLIEMQLGAMVEGQLVHNEDVVKPVEPAQQHNASTHNDEVKVHQLAT